MRWCNLLRAIEQVLTYRPTTGRSPWAITSSLPNIASRIRPITHSQTSSTQSLVSRLVICQCPSSSLQSELFHTTSRLITRYQLAGLQQGCMEESS